MRQAVFHHELHDAGTAQHLLNCVLLDYNCQLWPMGMIHVRV